MHAGEGNLTAHTHTHTQRTAINYCVLQQYVYTVCIIYTINLYNFVTWRYDNFTLKLHLNI